MLTDGLNTTQGRVSPETFQSLGRGSYVVILM